MTATNIGPEGSNYIWTSDGRNNPILNLRPNTNYEFIVNTLPEDDSGHELNITTKQSEDIAEGEGCPTFLRCQQYTIVQVLIEW